MINKSLVFIYLLLIPIKNCAFFGPLIKLNFNTQIRYITVSEDHYTYRNLKNDIAIEFFIPHHKIEAMDINTCIYLNLYSYELVKNLDVDKPLNLLITQRSSPKASDKSFFDIDSLPV